MIESYRALASDFYVNQRLNLKLDLPRERQTILEMFDRVRRQFPSMIHFRRYRDELALESGPESPESRWVAVRQNSVRSGVVNADLGDAYALHRHLLETAPYFLSISPLDVDYVELLYGFDLLAEGNHDEIVYQALVQGSPLAAVMDVPGSAIIDCRPMLGASIGEARSGDRPSLEVYFEIKTRSRSRPTQDEPAPEPISVFTTLRRYGPVNEVKDLPAILADLARRGEEIVEHRAVPHLVAPIRQAIGTGA